METIMTNQRQVPPASIEETRARINTSLFEFFSKIREIFEGTVYREAATPIMELDTLRLSDQMCGIRYSSAFDRNVPVYRYIWFRFYLIGDARGCFQVFYSENKGDLYPCEIRFTIDEGFKGGSYSMHSENAHSDLGVVKLNDSIDNMRILILANRAAIIDALTDDIARKRKAKCNSIREAQKAEELENTALFNKYLVAIGT